jgi:dolichol-phosphate mannosyltransferase
MEGFAFALSHGADFVVQMDADFSHSPKHIPEFIAAMADADVVVGSRYVEGGAVDPAWGWWREGLSRWANSVYTRLILGLDVRDVTSGFKCWSRPALRTILQYPLSSSGYIFQVEMAYVTDRLGFHVQELPIYFEDRRVGRSKLSWSVKIEAMWRTWYLPWRYRYMTRPAPRASLQARYTRSQGNV